MLNDIYRLGGDTDTIGAMAGSIWGAFNGENKINDLTRKVEDIDLINSLATSLHSHYVSKKPAG